MGELIIQGKARIGNADRIVIGQVIPVTVRGPFSVELLTPQLTLAPGQPAVLKGRLQRQAVFKETVQLKLDGLPRGVTLVAPPRPVPGDGPARRPGAGRLRRRGTGSAPRGAGAPW